MLSSIQVPPPKPKLAKSVRNFVLVVVLIAIVITAILCAISFGDIGAA